jgi:hypothetical protein
MRSATKARSLEVPVSATNRVVTESNGLTAPQNAVGSPCKMALRSTIVRGFTGSKPFPWATTPENTEPASLIYHSANHTLNRNQLQLLGRIERNGAAILLVAPYCVVGGRSSLPIWQHVNSRYKVSIISHLT